MDVKITPREKEVAQLVILGYTNYEIAHSLGISTHMVKIYLNLLFDKFEAKNRTELAYILGKNNII